MIPVLAMGESEFWGHRLSQVSLPSVPLYVPGEQGSHGPRSGPVNPGLHWHVVLPAPDFEEERTEQGVQVPLEIALASVEYFPFSHSTHGPLPVSSLYDPARHSWHWPPSGPEKPALHLHCSTVELPAGA